MNKMMVTVLIGVSLLSACASFDPVAAEPQVNSPDFHSLLQAMQPMDDDEILLTDASGIKSRLPDTRYGEARYCYVKDPQAMQDLIWRHCAAQSGAVRGGKTIQSRRFEWCTRGEGSKHKPLYGYKISAINNTCRTIQYVVPTTPVPTAEFERQAIEQHGYVSEAVRQYDEGKAMERVNAAQRKADWDRMHAEAKRAANLKVLGQRGQIICKRTGANTFEAAVEEVSGDRFKVLVQRAYLTGRPNISLGGFAPHYLWVDPAEWGPCN